MIYLSSRITLVPLHVKMEKKIKPNILVNTMTGMLSKVIKFTPNITSPILVLSDRCPFLNFSAL